MRRRQPPAEFSDEVPPRELLRFRPSQTPPVTADGRPMPWAVEWTAEEFAAFLRARAAWRDTHSRPLPGLHGLERSAMSRIGIPQALIDVEDTAPRGPFVASHRPAGPVVDRPASPAYSTREEAS